MGENGATGNNGYALEIILFFFNCMEFVWVSGVLFLPF